MICQANVFEWCLDSYDKRVLSKISEGFSNPLCVDNKKIIDRVKDSNNNVSYCKILFYLFENQLFMTKIDVYFKRFIFLMVFLAHR
jgi:hypothetical protein